MTAKFDAFKAALHALCIEHGVTFYEDGDYEDHTYYIGLGTDETPAGLHADFVDAVPLSAEEQAERRAQHEKQREEWRKAAAQRAKMQAEYERSPQYLAMVKLIGDEAAKTRAEQMRVSTDPNDPAYIDDRPRRVKSNDVEITDWAVADEFRRCVITKDGRVINGSVWIERLSAEPEAEVQAASTTLPVHAGFTGMFVNIPDVSPLPMAPAEPAKPAPVKPKKRRR